MMKSSMLHRVLSVIMAFAVISSSFSLTIEKQFCGSKLAAVSVLSKVKTCCKNQIPTDQNSQFSKEPCCSNVSLFYEGFDNYLAITTTDIEISLFTAPKSFPNRFLMSDFDSNTVLSYSKYKPPPRIVDVQVYHQVFII
jgi:hypothetical protein